MRRRGPASFARVALYLTVMRQQPMNARVCSSRRRPLPLLGMILGNTMTGISLGLDVLTNGVVRERAAVEACLALGGTRYQALLPVIRDALRSGFMPTINGMAAIGLVSLPEMITRQLFACVQPIGAIKYQILIMFLITDRTLIRI